MCGIIGTTNYRITSQEFEEAHKTIYHRGPDNQSFLQFEDMVFGHTRLSIVDLDERANQPFVYEFKDKKITVVFNGEIYNYPLLKKILQVKGYIFTTTSDTEVLCASYLEWGIECFDYFEGMWSVAIYDYNTLKLIIARDRVGKKPMYYCYENEQLSFGSSIWGVAKLAEKKNISTHGLQLFFALGYTPDDSSIIEGVKKLNPSKILVFRKDEHKFHFTEEKNSIFRSLETQKISVKKLLKKAVQKRLISSDVPVATLMSGGVDSTIITKLTKQINPETNAFFVDFEDKDLSEFYWANYLSKRNKINLNRVFLNNEDLEQSFQDYTKVYEEPFADYSGIPSIAIFKKVAQNYKVVLTGDGGDELFYGYPHYFKKWILFLLSKINSILKIESFLPLSVQRILQGNIFNFEANYLRNHAILTDFAAAYINKRFNEVIQRNNSFLKGLIQYDREFNNLPEKYLVKTDRASMYSGLEVRSPFMDEELLQKVKTLPIWIIFTPFISKLYLKLSYFKIFGFNYFFSKKKGFTPPIQKLRENYFKEINFLNLKEKIKNIDPVFYNEIVNLSYQNLEKDKIMFDRFFFFNLWLENNYYENI